MKGSIAWVGGDIVLTNQRLILAPLNINDLVKLTSSGLEIVPIPGSNRVMTIIGWAQKLVKQVDADAANITAVTIGQQAPTWNYPPSIVIHRTNGDPIEFGVLAGRLVPNVSKKNVRPRDELYSLVKQTLQI